MSVPTVHRGVVVKKQGEVEIKEQALPKYTEDQILVRVKAVSLNPVDFKSVDTHLTPGQSVGTDFAGDIAAVGSNVQKKNTWKVGDAVAGFIHAGLFEANNGSFQEYLVTLPEFIWKKSSDLPYEDAASMGGCALSTAVLVCNIPNRSFP